MLLLKAILSNLLKQKDYNSLKKVMIWIIIMILLLHLFIFLLKTILSNLFKKKRLQFIEKSNKGK